MAFAIVWMWFTGLFEQIMAKYLVTGGAGFIGSNLVRALLARGDSVRVLDDLSTGRVSNLDDVRERIVFLEGSITDLETCREAVAGVDYVLHQAALPSVPRSVQDPITSNAVNVGGTLNMLVAARDAQVTRFVYAGSSSAYGNTPTLPKVESMPGQPMSPYAIAKYTGELYCRAFFRLYGLETVVLRYFNIFGPYQDPGSPYSAVIPKFIGALLRGEAPVIHGDGTQSRDFTYIDNAVAANLLACTAPNAAGAVINCACGERTDLNTLAALLGEIIGADVSPRHEAARAGDVQHSLADMSKARDVLEYAPKVSLREGLTKTAAWYRERGGAAVVSAPQGVPDRR